MPACSGLDGVTPRLRLLVLQPTPFCNIDCSYCYLANRKNTARMTLDTLALASQRVFESGLLDRHLDVAWHAGEPLAVPLAWYEDAVALMEERRPSNLDLTHCFQTNGMLLDEAWARFLARSRSRIGLSIDGPADLHDTNRRTRAGHGTHARVMRAARLLQDYGLDFHVITVLTERALEDPDRLFDFYVRNGIREVGFNIEEIEGANGASSLARIGIEARFRQFIKRFFERAWQAPELIKVRELESTIGQLLSPEPVRDEQNRPFAVLSVSHDGKMSTFSPELLDARHPGYGAFALGHVATHSLSNIESSPQFQQICGEIRRGVEACERSCRYYRWCGGGAPINKLFETGAFDTSETMHCRLTRQIVLDEVLAGLEARTAPPQMTTAAVPTTPIDHNQYLR